MNAVLEIRHRELRILATVSSTTRYGGQVRNVTLAGKLTELHVETGNGDEEIVTDAPFKLMHVFIVDCKNR